MSSFAPLDGVRLNKRLMVYTAAGMYGTAGGIDVIERFIPGGRAPSIVPGLVALAVVAVLLVVERRLPRWGLAPLGPIAVGLIGYAMSTGPGASDAAVARVTLFEHAERPAGRGAGVR